MAQINTENVDLIDIKKQHITGDDLDYIKEKIGSYEAAFNKRAIKYRNLSESLRPVKDEDYRKLILDEYTFLKRPAAIIDGNVIIGNSSTAVETLKSLLN